MHEIELQLRDMNDHIDSAEYVRQFRMMKITASSEFNNKRLSLNLIDESYFGETNSLVLSHLKQYP
jgi:hypothetical protein